MKRIEELGVSPAPWTALSGDDGYRPCICDADGRYVLSYTGRKNRNADAALVAAAPELYEALRKVVDEMCQNCSLAAVGGDGCMLVDNGCFVKDGRKVLEKAGGAE